MLPNLSLLPPVNSKYINRCLRHTCSFISEERILQLSPWLLTPQNIESFQLSFMHLICTTPSQLLSTICEWHVLAQWRNSCSLISLLRLSWIATGASHGAFTSHSCLYPSLLILPPLSPTTEHRSFLPLSHRFYPVRSASNKYSTNEMPRGAIIVVISSSLYLTIWTLYIEPFLTLFFVYFPRVICRPEG